MEEADDNRSRRVRARAGWAAALAAAAALVPVTAHAARTVVTLSFDDERASQLNALPILDQFGMKASFFINSGRVGDSGRLTWSQIRAIGAAGHEIGGHTIDHEDLTSLSDAEATRQVCDDRDALIANGFPNPISFAYPFGEADADAEAIVGGCGYLFARAHGGIRSSGCSSCPPAEPIPPPNPLHLRSSRSIHDDDDLAYLQERVLLAETTGGWININFHDVCECSGTYVITPTLLREFLAWLAPRAATHDTVVLPMGQAFANESDPPDVALTAPADGATVLGTVALAATATDGTSVARVEFLVNGAVVATDTTAPYQGAWDSTSVPNGTARLAARATDAFGNAADSPAITVTVNNPPPDTTPPTVALGAPADGATVSGTVAVTATASDDRSGVARVDFLVNDVVFASDATAPYQVSWDTTGTPNGPAQLTARAIDGKGNPGLSAPRTVTVANFAPIAIELPFGSVWKYWDAGTDPGPTWFTAGFDDSTWASGPGELGYGDGDEETVLTRTTPRQPSVYFRRTLSLPGTPTTSASVRIKYDDGYAIWVNGTLAATRSVGSLAHSAYATSTNENTFRTITLPARLFRAGDNQLAVMIKQRSATSSDISFDLRLRITVQP